MISTEPTLRSVVQGDQPEGGAADRGREEQQRRRGHHRPPPAQGARRNIFGPMGNDEDWLAGAGRGGAGRARVVHRRERARRPSGHPGPFLSSPFEGDLVSTMIAKPNRDQNHDRIRWLRAKAITVSTADRASNRPSRPSSVERNTGNVTSFITSSRCCNVSAFFKFRFNDRYEEVNAGCFRVYLRRPMNSTRWIRLPRWDHGWKSTAPTASRNSISFISGFPPPPPFFFLIDRLSIFFCRSRVLNRKFFAQLDNDCFNRMDFLGPESLHLVFFSSSTCLRWRSPDDLQLVQMTQTSWIVEE